MSQPKESSLCTPQDRLLSAPISVWEKIDAAIKFYASYETYMSPRTGGVASGCPRSGPSPISVDHGRAASEVLMELVKLYPLAVEEAPPSEKSASARNEIPGADLAVTELPGGGVASSVRSARKTPRPDNAMHCIFCDGRGWSERHDPNRVQEPVQTHNYAPAGKLWQCGACGKITRDQYGEEGGWDESCMLNSFLIDDPMANPHG